MARGGSRSGRPGANYSNRSDLQNAPRLAPTAPKGQPYGVAGQQLSSQQQIPLGPPPVPLAAPSARPSEPVQSGLSLGPGVGPDAIPALNAPAPGPDPDLINFIPYLPGLELLSTLPTASSATRNFIRRLRGAIPPDIAQ